MLDSPRHRLCFFLERWLLVVERGGVVALVQGIGVDGRLKIQKLAIIFVDAILVKLGGYIHSFLLVFTLHRRIIGLLNYGLCLDLGFRWRFGFLVYNLRLIFGR